jgi:hypothetical protein
VTKVPVRNKRLSCSRKQTDIGPKFSMFCALNTPFHIIILVCLRISFPRIHTSVVRATLLTSVPQGANHFCGPSDLLSTTTCFSKLVAYVVWCFSCGQHLIRFATHCCPTASTACAACTIAEPQTSLPKNAHEHYHDLLKHCIHNFARQY